MWITRSAFNGEADQSEIKAEEAPACLRAWQMRVLWNGDSDQLQNQLQQYLSEQVACAGRPSAFYDPRRVTMANKEQLEILKQGVRAWNDWRMKKHPLIDLSGADLSGIKLSSVDIFTHLEVSLGKFSETNFSNADLGGAVLVNADLRGCNFQNAHLSGCEMWGADLDNANLRGAILYDTDFTEASLIGADFSNSVMDGTRFGGVDLSAAKGLDAVRHDGPCRIDVDTLYLSHGGIPERFLVGAGLPDAFIAYVKSLVTNPIEYYSCFISYSSKDQKFADLLHSQMRSKQLRVWLATEDLKIGDRFRSKIDEAIHLYDKLLLVLSSDSVDSPWVETEVESALEKERKQHRTVLFPIRLDNAVMETDQAWAANIRRTRHIGDFTRWKKFDRFEKAFARLLRDLKV
jgi:TIR domain/Pentapeptide repeats (8 copies)